MNESWPRTSTAAKQGIVVHHHYAGTWKHTRHTALDNVIAATKLTEHNPHVALQS